MFFSPEFNFVNFWKQCLNEKKTKLSSSKKPSTSTSALTLKVQCNISEYFARNNPKLNLLEILQDGDENPKDTSKQKRKYYAFSEAKTEESPINPSSEPQKLTCIIPKEDDNRNLKQNPITTKHVEEEEGKEQDRAEEEKDKEEENSPTVERKVNKNSSKSSFFFPNIL